MDTERSAAKAAITSSDGDDPELSGAFSEAGRLRVDLEKEANRHKENMAAGERGWLGHALGGTANAPLTIAFLTLTFGALAWLWCLNQAHLPEADTEFWGRQSDRALALSGTALGYVFGQRKS